MQDDMIPDDPVQHTVPRPANIMSPIMERSLECDLSDECNSLGRKGLSVDRWNGYFSRSDSSRSSESDLSEFDSSDHQEDFEVWSSDNTSPEASDEETDANNKVGTNDDLTENFYWRLIRQENIQTFKFTGIPCLSNCALKDRYSPLECFKLIVTDDIINLMVTETNSFAKKTFTSPGRNKEFPERWFDVTVREIKKFLGLMMFMSTIRSPGLTFYWSGSSDTGNGLASRIMTETRFKHILAYWNFGKHMEEHSYSKVKNIVNMLNRNFKRYKEPGEKLYIGKETIYLRDIYAFQKQILGIPDPKRGLRLLRLIDGGLYTYKIAILPPENFKTRTETTKKVVMEILRDYLQKGRKISFHNLYISLDLAKELLKNKTHTLGRVRKYSRGTPRDLIKKRLEIEEAKGFQTPEGISVVKYKTIIGNKIRRGYALSSCHGQDTVPLAKIVKGGRSMFIKNQSKILADLHRSDKLFDSVDEYSYCDSPLNNQTTWYRRMIHELLTGICVINAYCLYKKLNNHRSKFYKFHTQLWRQLVGFEGFREDSGSSDETFEGEG